ncbi:MAG: class I SAM-dependent rRNA methyltransferase [Phaeodactylibacter sp.]|nr:class I SAM-dependent rRNA methyltransferase [Phaeodactylibacter sp.]MCB9276151.1 class I SAM-dependent rRNA methyltransferase [Lewinellaceae bacterium]
MQKRIIIKNKKAAAAQRFHPWVFSGAVKAIEGPVEDGDVVEVYQEDGSYLATGHYQDGSICVRLFSFLPVQAEQAFWNQKIGGALACRKALGLAGNPHTDCYRLVHGEGDGLPGLIIDIYGSTAVVQCHSIGMHRMLGPIAGALRENYGDALVAVYDKSSETLPATYASGVKNGYVFGESAPQTVQEHGHTFWVDWESGQKTGFFLDQRENRWLTGQYARDKKVLNAFCYTGGFSVYALKAGARQVDSVDVSRTAMAVTDRNVELNGAAPGTHQSFAEDTMAFLKAADADYDLMVIDPPAFAKSIKKRHNAVQGYKRLNALALSKLRAGGLLFTFSCSQVVGRQLFYDTIVAAALETRRQVRVLHHLSQPPDHPVNIYHPEGEYLKGLVLYVE